MTQIAVPIRSGSISIGTLVVFDEAENVSNPTKINFPVAQILPFLGVLADLVSLPWKTDKS